MTETRIIRIKDLPTRKLRKRVRRFLKEDVSVKDVKGKWFDIILNRQILMMKSDDDEYTLSTEMQGDYECDFRNPLFY